eukprot:GHVQ01019402.1.p1 GENE.GHVQ01019402.1~~GHVQ01019402.1.p1  ORF type:complete len:347 (-),score=37.28 GHVQ01019402.1:4355-5395(-)
MEPESENSHCHIEVTALCQEKAGNAIGDLKSKLSDSKPSLIDEIRQDLRKRTLGVNSAAASCYVSDIGSKSIRQPSASVVRAASYTRKAGGASSVGVLSPRTPSAASLPPSARLESPDGSNRLSCSMGPMEGREGSQPVPVGNAPGANGIVEWTSSDGAPAEQDTADVTDVTSLTGLDSKGACQLLKITQEVIAFSNILDESRSRAIEEANRLRSQKDNLESMLQASCNREQVNLAEVKKQRDLLSQWQERFTELKTHSMSTLSDLEVSRDSLKSQLDTNAAECEKCKMELEALEKARERERLEYANMQDMRERFTEISLEKQELQREVTVTYLQVMLRDFVFTEG